MQIASYNTTQITSKIKIGSIYGLVIAAAFWIPDIVIHAYGDKSFFSREVRFMTAILPLISASSFYVVRKVREYKDSQALAIINSVLGIWITGPFFMMISSSFSGGGFSRSDAGFFVQISFLVTCTAGFPIFTFMMSTYDGTLFALLITTALLPIIGMINKNP